MILNGPISGIIEFVLGGQADHRLLNLRTFEITVRKRVYNRQTQEAEQIKASNCPDFARNPEDRNDNGKKIWIIHEMEGDHIKPWSQGGKTVEDNCHMLCKRHNNAKSNIW